MFYNDTRPLPLLQKYFPQPYNKKCGNNDEADGFRFVIAVAFNV